MHIELTDHLRCPGDHDEAFLVLIPDRMEGRRVIAGHLGCPVCGWSSDWSDAVPVFGDAPEPATTTPPFDAESTLAMLGIEGPGGWVALGGRAGALAAGLEPLLPDVSLVTVNPPEGVMPTGAISVIRSATWPVKRHALRGVILGEDAVDAAAALGSALPGLRIVGEGPLPTLGVGDEVIAEAGGVWVVRKG